MRRAGLLIFLFALAIPLAATEIRVAQVADEELISVEGPAVESESRRVARLNAKIHDLSSRLRHTYQQYLDAGGRAEGTLVLSFTIKEDGYLDDIEVVRGTLREPELVRALIERMSRWFFVPNRDEEHPGTVSCVYPFVFSTRVFYSPVVVEPLREGGEVPPGRRPYWIDREISPQVRELEDIYSVYLLANPRLAGTITFEFVLSSAGVVERVSVLENTTGAASLAGDVAAKISRWSFSALEGHGPDQDVVVTYPMVFGAGRVGE